MTNSNNHINGIRCDVTNCHYNKNSSMCTASQISVGPTYASSSADTVCATFKPDTTAKM